MINRKFLIVVMIGFFTLIVAACGEKTSKEQVGKEKTSTVHVSEQVEKSCMSCHAVDDQGKLERIEYMRKTPEGWAQTIARMERLHGVELTDEEREVLIEDLSMKRGLAPKEAEQIQYWIANKPSYMEKMLENESVNQSCISCHAGGRAMAQRRSAEEWENLKDFHLTMFPSIYLNHRHTDWPVEAEKALKYLAKEYPLESKEWDEWKDKQLNVEGNWKVVGFQATKGYYIGESEFKKGEKGFSEQKRIKFLDSDKEVDINGDVRMFTGYMVRAHYMQGDKKLTGTYNVLQNGDVIKGDWSQKDNLGITGEETYYKVQTEKPEVIHMEPRALKKGTTNKVTLYGMNLNELAADDLSLPKGISVENISIVSDDQAEVEINVDKLAEIGTKTLEKKAVTVHQQMIVYDNVDYIKIEPEFGIARMGGGGPMNKMSTQYVAYAFSNGKDGKEGTDDDMKLYPVDAKWVLEAYPGGEGERDDRPYIGEIDESGLFTPNEEGINEEREFIQENVGSVTVVAEVTIDGKTLTDKSHHVSTVPDYDNFIH